MQRADKNTVESVRTRQRDGIDFYAVRSHNPNQRPGTLRDSWRKPSRQTRRSFKSPTRLYCIVMLSCIRKTGDLRLRASKLE